ncbi:MAG: mannosyl-3-phosphoglycerate synthase [Acidilobaceae archaeon]|nr:mannosyl-3-phosphoglycerate synthase [Acidilobaceae archaeon]
MLLRMPPRLERFGAVTIYDVAEVIALDSMGLVSNEAVYGIPPQQLAEQASRTFIVIPTRDEDPLLLEGVISSVPLPSPVVLVSASSLEPLDFYSHELEVIRTHARLTGRRALAVHQHDPAWREALEGTPLKAMLEGDAVRRGKGEGMVLGVLVASWLGAQFVGFIDADNYVPGAVHEYALAYYTGFSLLNSRFSMVRVAWYYKGKPDSSHMLFRKWGRVSYHANSLLNLSVSLCRRVETNVIKTTNSGEHALSMELALSLPWAGGYAVEAFQLVYLLEACYVQLEGGGKRCPFLPAGVKVLQAETRNPHIHSEKGEAHLARMAAESLGALYHSALALEKVRAKVRGVLSENYYEEEPPAPRIYELEGINAKKAVSTYLERSLLAFDSRRG